MFPPQSGLTLSTWFCVDKFSNAGNDGHPVRLLTIVRNIQGRDENLICLSVFLTSRDRALIVTTQESYMPVSGQLFGVRSVCTTEGEEDKADRGAGIACWLECGTYDRKVASSNPSMSGGRIVFSGVNFVC